MEYYDGTNITSEMPCSFAFMAKQIKAKHPVIWQMLEPKVFKGTENYNDHKAIYCDFAVPFMAIDSKSPEMFHSYGVMDSLFRFTLQKDFNIPIFFVSKPLLDAVIKSNANFSIDWETMRFPYSSFNFVMPKNSLHINSEEIVYIDISRLLPAERRRMMTIAQLPTHFDKNPDKPSLVINAVTTRGTKYTKQLCEPFNPFEYYDLTKNEFLLEGEVEMVRPESEELDRLPNIVFNLLFAMAARPELIETGRKLGRQKKSNSEIWSPNIIGRKYTVKHSEGYDELSSEHGTKRMHWRRGHFRNQPYGKGLTETKIIWLEPSLIGVKTVQV
jgi:hypothetical protein